jgi:type I restriction enzyme S subunit
LGPKFLRITDIQDGKVEWSTVPGADVTAEVIERYRLKEGDIVFARTGATTGKSFLIRACPDAIFASYLIRLRLKPGILPEYLAHFFDTSNYWTQISNKKKGSGQPGVNASVLSTLEVDIAPVAQQRRIVDALDSYLTRLDAAAEGLKRVEANLKRYRASVLKAAVEGRLVPTEAELAKKEGRPYEPATVLLARILEERRRHWEESELAKMKAKGEIPKNDKWKDKYEAPAQLDVSELPSLPDGWRWTRLDMVSQVQLGQQRHPTHTSAEKKLPYIRAANITWSGLDLSDVNAMGFPDPARYSLEYGDVLLSEASGSPLEVGKPAIWRDEIPGACYQKTLLRVRSFDKEAVLPEFLRLVFLRECFTGAFARLAPGVGIVHITAERLVAWMVPLPPTEEQKRIVEHVQALESQLDQVKATVATNLVRIATVRQSILKWAFEGKLVDQDPNDEPASVLLARIKAERAASEAKVPPPRKAVRRAVGA